MTRLLAALALAGAMIAFVAPPSAAGPVQTRMTNDGRYVPVFTSAHSRGSGNPVWVPASAGTSGKSVIPRADPRPGKWCMWWLRRALGIPRTAFRAYEWNLARAGRYIGAPAAGAAVGIIVVWRHHVGVITGRAGDGRWIVKSGNDGGRVRERPRSLKGAIAFRRWDGGWSEAYSARRAVRP